jgi:hypothetical protein
MSYCLLSVMSLSRHLDVRRGLMNFLQVEFREISPFVEMTPSNYLIPNSRYLTGNSMLNSLPSPFPKMSGFPSPNVSGSATSTFVTTFILPPCALMMSYAKLNPNLLPVLLVWQQRMAESSYL